MLESPSCQLYNVPEEIRGHILDMDYSYKNVEIICIEENDDARYQFMETSPSIFPNKKLLDMSRQAIARNRFVIIEVTGPADYNPGRYIPVITNDRNRISSLQKQHGMVVARFILTVQYGILPKDLGSAGSGVTSLICLDMLEVYFSRLAACQTIRAPLLEHDMLRDDHRSDSAYLIDITCYRTEPANATQPWESRLQGALHQLCYTAVTLGPSCVPWEWHTSDPGSAEKMEEGIRSALRPPIKSHREWALR